MPLYFLVSFVAIMMRRRLNAYQNDSEVG